MRAVAGILTDVESLQWNYWAMPRIDMILGVVGGWIAIGAWALLAMNRTKFVARRLFPLGAMFGLALSGLSVQALFDAPQDAVLVIGLPGLPFHLRLDALSSFFLAVLGRARRASRSSAPAISAPARARRRGSCASSTTSSSRRWPW